MKTENRQYLKKTLAQDLPALLAKYEVEEVFAIAVYIQQEGLGYFIGTAHRLKQIAEQHHNQYKEQYKERFLLSGEEIAMLDVKQWAHHRLYASIENLKVYLKWTAFDDFWYVEDFGDSEEGLKKYHELISGVEEMEIGDFLEKQIILCLKELLAEGMIKGEACYFGTTFGEDERDFLRSATMLHSYKRVGDLWQEYGLAQELSHYSLEE